MESKKAVRSRSKKRSVSPEPALEHFDSDGEEKKEESIKDFSYRSASPWIPDTVWSAVDLTAPGMSFVFIALFVFATAMHKIKFSITAVGVVCWLALQIAGSVSRDQQHVDVWYVLSLLGNLVYYLVLGVAWAICKLYIDIRQGAVPEAVLAGFAKCAGNLDCILSNIPPLVPEIVQNIVSWPMSIAYTITSDPLAIIGKFAYGNLRRHFAGVVVLALANNNGESILGIWWTVATILAYVAIGFLWSHAKLYIDVWQGCLPTHLDQELQNLYQRNQTYWAFIQKIKGFVVLWGLMWPFSILHTLLRHPLRIIFDYLYEISKKKYHWIIQKAMELRFGQRQN
jgi:hypothetical protein